jgi:predicted deacylase
MSTKVAPFSILGQEVQPGKGGRFTLEIAKLHTNTPIQVPVIVQHAKKKGPVLLLIAALHGDEINGTEIVRQFIKNGWNKPEKGTVICIPVFNIFGFLNLSRELPDKRDLNRVFPGTKNGSLASQFAYHFMTEIAPLVDIVIDLHTGSVQRNNYPQTRCDFKHERSMELCKTFGSPFILNSPLISKTIRATMQKLGKDYILFEGGKANRIDDFIVQHGIDGIRRVMNYLEIRKFTSESTHEDIIELTESQWLRSPNSGVLNLKIKNGIRVERGTLLATVSDPYGNFERAVKAPRGGFVICVNESPLVNKGDALFHIGK